MRCVLKMQKSFSMRVESRPQDGTLTPQPLTTDSRTYLAILAAVPGHFTARARFELSTKLTKLRFQFQTVGTKLATIHIRLDPPGGHILHVFFGRINLDIRSLLQNGIVEAIPSFVRQFMLMTDGIIENCLKLLGCIRKTNSCLCPLFIYVRNLNQLLFCFPNQFSECAVCGQRHQAVAKPDAELAQELSHIYVNGKQLF